MFNAYDVYHNGRYSLLFTHAFLHSNFWHLAINMYVLWSFGILVEHTFTLHFSYGHLTYLLMYLFAIPVSVMLDLFLHKDHPYYFALGASGAVSAVVYSFIFFYPTEKLALFFVLPMPAIVFAVLFLIYSAYMAKRGMDNIGHTAHFMGAVFGFFFPAILKPELLGSFFEKIF